MLKLGDLKQGDIISVNDDGVEREGVVVKISHEDHQVLVDNGVQEFWYTLEEMKPIPLDEAQLMQPWIYQGRAEWGYEVQKRLVPAGNSQKDDFSNIEMWWREDRRHFSFPLGVHQLQNLHLDMTKVPLEKLYVE